MKRIVVASLVILGAMAPLRADQSRIYQFAGATMATRYSVKVFDPPEFDEDIRLEVDALLRRVNSQMSTYLKSSEISRFNDSESTDWFEVSPETATVVDFAQQVAGKTGGAFDVTVGPLVNAWSFGPDPRTRKIPDPAKLEQLKQTVGFEKLSVRIDPPALRKSHPGVQVDLSAIAKGFAVDQVVSLLHDAGAQNVFVEIGGEVRTSGNKSGQWWKVGIQLPDAEQETVMIAHALSTGGGDDHSMATSGDYRNYFEVDGVRYSHTIDPRTSKPIDHALASVSVVTGSCMEADAWATAINVLGPDAGLALAQRENLDVLLSVRNDGGFQLRGTGALAAYASASAAAGPVENPAAVAGAGGANALALMGITAVAFGLVLSAMAVGVIFGRRSISGSCGGLANTKNEDGSISCSLCSNPDDACQELRKRMEQRT